MFWQIEIEGVYASAILLEFPNVFFNCKKNTLLIVSYFKMFSPLFNRKAILKLLFC